MFRLYFSIFWNKQANVHDHHGEGSWSMKGPLVILAICTVIAGFIPFSNYVSSDKVGFHSELHLTFAILPVLLSITGIALAAYFFLRPTERPDKATRSLSSLYQLLYRKFYIDEIYLFITKQIIFRFIARPAAWIDKNIIDAGVQGSATATGKLSESIKAIQSGKVQGYAMYFFGGIIVLGLVFLYLWK
jgi:NADH-quinone oxidoreductase subunit L